MIKTEKEVKDQLAEMFGSDAVDDNKESLKLLKKLNNGEVKQGDIDNNIMPDHIVETKLDNLILNDNTSSSDSDDDSSDLDINIPKSPKVSKNKKNRERRKENKLIDKMAIQQLEIEKSEQSERLNMLERALSEHNQFIQQSRVQQQNSVSSNYTNRIDQLENELVAASSVYDNVKIAKINSELIQLKVEAELSKYQHGVPATQHSNFNPAAYPTSVNTPQYASTYQQPTPQYQQSQAPTQSQLLIQKQILGFAARPQNQWTNTEFNNNAQPLTNDAQTFNNIILQLQNEGRDMRTAAFWDMAERRATQALPHKYSNKNSGKKSPPVATGANQGVSNKGNIKDPIDLEIIKTMKLLKSQPINPLRFEGDSAKRDELRFMVNLKKQMLAAKNK